MDKFEEVLAKVNSVNSFNRLEIWKRLLEEYTKNANIPLYTKDSEAWAAKLDMKNQSVIKSDSKRTRAEISGKFPLREYLEIMLTGYCKINMIKYTQGLNELLAPFLLLKKEGSTTGLHVLLNLFSRFVHYFLPTCFIYDEFHCLEYAILMLHRLLKFHDPETAYFLSDHLVTPDLYATSCKYPLDIVYRIWDYLLYAKVPEFYLYFAVALIMHNRNRLLKTPLSDLPQVTGNLAINSFEELEKIMKLSYEIMANTPASFQENVQKSCMFQKSLEEAEVRNKLREAEKCNIMTVNAGETLSGTTGEMCSCCIMKQLHKQSTVEKVKTSKNLFTRSLSFSARTSSRSDSTARSQHRTRAQSKAPDGSQCKICRRKLKKVFVMEVGKNSGKPLVCKTRVDPAQLQMELSLKKTAATIDSSYGIIMIADTSSTEVIRISEILIREKRRYVGVYLGDIQELLQLKSKLNLSSSPKKHKESSPIRQSSFIDKMAAMFGFAQKTISTLPKQPMKLSFVASYSTDEENFNAALKMSTEGLFSPKSAGKKPVIKAQSTIQARHTVAKTAGRDKFQKTHSSSPEETKTRKDVMKPSIQLFPLTLSNYALTNGISEPLIFSKSQMESPMIMKLFIKDYKVKRFPEREEQTLQIFRTGLIGIASKDPLPGKITLVSRFYWKDLLKITSKTQDGTILIFYFGLTESTGKPVHRLEEALGLQTHISSKDFPTRHKKYKKVEIRYQFESIEKAKDCISCVKYTYKQLKQQSLP